MLILVIFERLACTNFSIIILFSSKNVCMHIMCGLARVIMPVIVAKFAKISMCNNAIIRASTNLLKLGN